MAKAKKIEPVVIPYIQPNGGFLLKLGKQFYKRLQPVPYRYCKPNFKLLKAHL